jgi:hypothetical protein
MGLYLSNTANDDNSEIILGDINATLAGDNMSVYLNLTSDVYWQVQCKTRTFNKQPFSPSSNDVIFDTGIPFILMDISINNLLGDFQIIKNYFEQKYTCVLNENILSYTCTINAGDDIASFPDLQLNFSSSFNHTINSTTYVRKIVHPL